MVSLLKQPAFRDRTLPLSVKAWHSMIDQGTAPERSELLRGAIIEKMPKSISHPKLAGRLLLLLQALPGDAQWVRKEEPLTLADSEPEPDLSVVTGGESDYQLHPTRAKFVIEVSVTTLAEDRELASMYAEAGVDEYRIVNAAERCIEIHRHPAAGKYAEVSKVAFGASAKCLALPGLVVETTALFEGLPPTRAA